MSNTEKRPLEIYLHVPFCKKKCFYCDFLSKPADKKTQDRYFEALLEEIRRSAYLGKNRIVTSVFTGGGTPSFADTENIVSVMRCLKENFCFSADTEITIEANPGTLSKEKLIAYKECGINRLSLGLQSIHGDELKKLGRIHSYEEFLKSFQLAKETGFTNINVDLMFDIPGQDLESWRETLRTVAELHPEHISAYSLIVEEGTPFGDNPPLLPDEDTEYQMYEDTELILSEYGYQQYEISNYAKPGFACRHNIGYWRGTDYLGMGLGASSLYENVRYSNTRNMEEYSHESKNPKNLRRNIEVLTEEDCMEEFMFLGLRMTEGISEAEFLRRFGCSLEEIYGKVLKKYRELALMEYKNGFWSFTRRGIHVSNSVLAEFLFDNEEE